MTEPSLPPPPPPPPPIGPGGRPFTGEPKPLPGGCSRPVMIGCGVVVVLLGIAAIAFVAKAKDLLAWTMSEVEKQVVAALPPEVTSEERQRLERAFDAAIEKLKAGEVETPPLYALQQQLTKAADRSQKRSMTRDDVLDLLSALERVGGLLVPVEEPAESAAEPVPATASP